MHEQADPPKPLLDLDDLYVECIPIWEAFWLLDGSRSLGFSIGSIPLLDIVVYWRDVFGVNGREDLMEKVFLIKALDDEYVRTRNKD